MPKSITDNFSTWLDRNFHSRPEKIALHFSPSETWTFRQLYQAVARFAAGLQRSSLMPGDRVAISLDNSPEFVIASLAVMRAGMVVVPFDTRLQRSEIEYQLSDSGALCVIAGKRTARMFRDLSPKLVPAIFITADRESAGKLSWHGIDLLTEGEVVPAMRDTLAQIHYTCGSDGYPAGAMLTHGNLTANCRMNAEAMAIAENDRCTAAVPLSHTYGAMPGCYAPLSAGATVYLQPYFSLRNFLKTMQEFAITLILGVPTVFASLAFHDSFAPSWFHSVRLLISGGAPLPLEIYERYQKLGLEIRQGYGLTECSPSVSLNLLNASNKPLSIGLPLPGIRLQIAGCEGEEVNREGELLVRGPSVMQGYWNKPALTARALENGWLHTGDLAKRDGDGYYYITGRLKNVIISGGLNIHPKEVERQLLSHPKVNRVCVVSVPDLVYGELVKAVVHLKEGRTLSERELANYARENMAFYKIPRIFEIQS